MEESIIMDYQTHFLLHLEALRPKHVSYAKNLHVNASDAGGCDRALFYKLRNNIETGGERDPVQPRSAIAFHIGNNLHDEYQAMMHLLHPSFTGEIIWQYPHDGDPLMTGRSDGTYADRQGRTIALEIKSASKFIFGQAMKSGQPRGDHALQAALSAYVLRTQLVQIVYIAKEYNPEYTDALKIWTYPVGDIVSELELQRMAFVLDVAKANGPVPDRIIQGEEILDPETSGHCKFCDHVDSCVIDGPIPIRSLTRRRKA